MTKPKPQYPSERRIQKIVKLKNDPVFIENVARQELGMIGEGEVILKFKNKQ